MLIDSGKKINKFYQERLKYFNELKYELERNSKLLEEIEKQDNFICEQNRHIRDYVNQSATRIGLSDQDLDRLNNLTQEYSDTIDEYKQKLIDEKIKCDRDIDNFKNYFYTEKELKEYLSKRYENLEEDNKKLNKDIELKQKDNMSYIDKIFNLENKIKKDQYKICNMLNKFNDNMENDRNNLYETFREYDNKINAKLNKLNDNIEKINNYIIENNNKKVDIEKKLDVAKNQYNNFLLKYNQSRKELMETKDRLNETKDKLDKAGGDIIKKIKYIEKIGKIKYKLNYQNAKVIELESELNTKNKAIRFRKNEHKKIIEQKNKYEKEIKKIKKIKEELSSSSANISTMSNEVDKKKYVDMPYLETEEEAAKNIADIIEQRNIRKKDNKARTFAPPDDTNEKLEKNFKNKSSMTEEKLKKLINDNTVKKK